MIRTTNSTNTRDRGFNSAGTWNRLRRAGAIAASAGLAAAPAWAGPEDGTVAAGAASISRNGPLTTIHQKSPNAIINWRSFDIGTNETVRFVQPSATARAMNRITGANPSPSQIHGSLQANGIVYIVNPAGVIFGPTASVNVGGILAAGGAMSNKDFMAGRNRFTSITGPVHNLGSIRAESIAALVGSSVVSTGNVYVPEGTVVMAAGDKVVLGSPLGGVMVSLPRAEGGAGADARMDVGGDIKARNVSLVASDMFSLAINGRIDVSGRTGGSVVATAGEIALNGSINAAGVDQGGTVLIGGDVQGSGDLPTAERTMVAPSARIDAGASHGDAGKVVVWADGYTDYRGSIDAAARSGNGDGGFVEVSGLEGLTFAGDVDVSSVAGAPGTILLDPTDIVIVQFKGVADSLDQLDDFDDPNLGPNPDQTVVDVETLRQLAEGGQIVLKASRDIIIQADLSDFFLDALVLIAGRSIIAQPPGQGQPVPTIEPGAVALLMANAGPGDLLDGSAPDPGVRGKGPGGIDAGIVFGVGPDSLAGLDLGGFPVFGDGIDAHLLLGSGFADDHVGLINVDSYGGVDDVVVAAPGRQNLAGPRGDIDIDFVSGKGGALLVRDADAVTLGEVLLRLDLAAVRSMSVADQQNSAGGSAEELIDISTSADFFEGTLAADRIVVNGAQALVTGDYDGASSINISADTVEGIYDAPIISAIAQSASGVGGSISGEFTSATPDGMISLVGEHINVTSASAGGTIALQSNNEISGDFDADVITAETVFVNEGTELTASSSINVVGNSINGTFEAPDIDVLSQSLPDIADGEILGTYISIGAEGVISLDGVSIQASATADNRIVANAETVFGESTFIAGTSINAFANFIDGTYQAPDIDIVSQSAGKAGGGQIFGSFTSPGSTGLISLDAERISGVVEGGGDLRFVARGAQSGAIDIISKSPSSDFDSLTIMLDNPGFAGGFASISLPEGGLNGLALGDDGVFSIGSLGSMTGAGGLDVTIELMPLITGGDNPSTSFDQVMVASDILTMADGRMLRLVGEGGLTFTLDNGPLGMNPGAASGAFEILAGALMDQFGQLSRPGMINLKDVYTNGDQFYFAEGGVISASTDDGALGFLTGGGSFTTSASLFSLDGAGDTTINTSGAGGVGDVLIQSGVSSFVGAGLFVEAVSADASQRADIAIQGPITLSAGEQLVGTGDLFLSGDTISIAGDVDVAGSAEFDLPDFESIEDGTAVLDLSKPGGGMTSVAAGGDIIIRGGGPVGGGAFATGDAVIVRSSAGVRLFAPNGSVIADQFTGVLVEVGDFIIDTSGGQLGGDVNLSDVFVDTGGLRIISDGSVTFTQDGVPLFVIVRDTLDTQIDPQGRAIWIEAADLLQIAQLADAGAEARVLFLAGHETLPALESPGGSITLQGAMISLVMNADSDLVVRSTGGDITFFANAVDVVTRNDDPRQVIISADGGDPSDPDDPGRLVRFESLEESPLEVDGLSVIELVPTLHRMFNHELGDPDRFDLDQIEQIIAEIDALTVEIDALEMQLALLDPLSQEAAMIRDEVHAKRTERTDKLLSIVGQDAMEGLLDMFDESFAELLDEVWETLRTSGGGPSLNESAHKATEDRRDDIGTRVDDLVNMFGTPDLKAARIEDLLDEFNAIVDLRMDQIADVLARLQDTRARIQDTINQLRAIDDPIADAKADEFGITLAMCDQLIAKMQGFQADFDGFDMSLNDVKLRFDDIGGVYDESTFDEICLLLDELLALEPMLKDSMYPDMIVAAAEADTAKAIDLSRNNAPNLNPATQDMEMVYASPDATPRPLRRELILSEAEIDILRTMAIYARPLDADERVDTTAGRALVSDVPRDRLRSLEASDYAIANNRFDVRGVRIALSLYQSLFLQGDDQATAEERQDEIRNELIRQTAEFAKSSDNLFERDPVAHRQFIRENAPQLDADLNSLTLLIEQLEKMGMTHKEAAFSRQAIIELVRPKSDISPEYMEKLLTEAPAADESDQVSLK
jgi:filamentous hemagglutinin family protein